MKTKNLEEMYQYKNSDTAVYLCSGSSINNITESQWNKISKVDTWTLNNWVYHSFIPKFYHIEGKNPYKKILKERLDLKKDEFNNTNFIVNSNRYGNLEIVENQKNIYLYDTIIKPEASFVKHNPIIHLKYEPSINPNILIMYNLSSSAAVMLDLLWKFRYKKVIIFGMDMYNSKYFWTGKPEYGETHCQFNHDKVKTKTQNDPHKTYKIKDYIIWFCKEWMSKIDCEVFVGYTDTLLYPDLEYFNVEKL